MTHADQNQIESGFFCQSHIYFDDKFDLKMAYFYLDYVSSLLYLYFLVPKPSAII